MVTLGLVVAQYNKERPITHEMEAAGREAAADRGAEIATTVEIPGAYDAPLAADRLARRNDIDAVAVLGAVITGDTDHDQVITAAAAKGLTDVSLDRDTPVIFGVTGPGQSVAEAEERIPKGAEAIESAVDIAEELMELDDV
jgi:6,7-dimethyl-8-ribityllumazine synthase